MGVGDTRVYVVKCIEVVTHVVFPLTSTGTGAVMEFRGAIGVVGVMDVVEGDGRCILLLLRCTVSSTMSEAVSHVRTCGMWVMERESRQERERKYT